MLTIEGYDTPIDLTAMYLSNTSIGSDPATNVAVAGGGAITISTRTDISAEKAYIAIPVYKI